MTLSRLSSEKAQNRTTEQERTHGWCRDIANSMINNSEMLAQNPELSSMLEITLDDHEAGTIFRDLVQDSFTDDFLQPFGSESWTNVVKDGNAKKQPFDPTFPEHCGTYKLLQGNQNGASFRGNDQEVSLVIYDAIWYGGVGDLDHVWNDHMSSDLDCQCDGQAFRLAGIESDSTVLLQCTDLRFLSSVDDLVSSETHSKRARRRLADHGQVFIDLVSAWLNTHGQIFTGKTQLKITAGSIGLNNKWLHRMRLTSMPTTQYLVNSNTSIGLSQPMQDAPPATPDQSTAATEVSPEKQSGSTIARAGPQPALLALQTIINGPPGLALPPLEYFLPEVLLNRTGLTIPAIYGHTIMNNFRTLRNKDRTYDGRILETVIRTTEPSKSLERRACRKHLRRAG